jgi:hypothetical protein
MKTEISYSEHIFEPIPGFCRHGATEAKDNSASIVQSLQNPAYGFAHVRLQSNESWSLDKAKSQIVSLLSEIASPITVYKRHGLWKSIGVNPKVEPSKVEGIGIIPLHIDCVNTANPPDFVAFLCTRGDPRGGGYSLISSFSGALSKLTTAELNALRGCWVREGKFFDMDNVGGERNPFPILDCSDRTIEWIRYTAKPHRIETTEQKFALDALTAALISGSYKVPLMSGEVLILNQRLAAHGRLALGTSQNEPAPSEDRELLQIFFRAKGLAASAGSIPTP